MKRIFILFSLAFLTLILIGCEGPKPTYTITFLSTGGSKVENQTVVENSAAIYPEEPTRSGYVFRYWYETNPDLPFDFETLISTDFTLRAKWGVADVVLSTKVTVPFKNLTTEYNVEDSELDLYFPEGSVVPYVKVVDFFDLLAGFIDTEIEITFTEDEDSLEIFYQYYDEDEDHLYDLYNHYDLNTNLITTNDPGFYWAYIYSTETNFGRNIEYLYDYEANEYIEGSNIVFNLNDYNLDLVYHDDGILAPYYLVNQLYAGSSYYNVYYNGDALYGIYGQISSSSNEYRTIRNSSLNDTNIPQDLLQHNYDMLAFNLNYFYGLKDFQAIENFYQVMNPYKTRLFSNNPETVSQAIADLLLKTIDEPHTSFGFSGYYNKRTYNPPTNSLTNYGPRFNDWYMDGLVAADDAIAARWNINAGNSWAASSPQRPKYWFIDDNSAVISFDGFDTADIWETLTWDDVAYHQIFDIENLLPVLEGGTRYFVYNQSTLSQKISETLIWGLDSSSLASYGDLLESSGWTFIQEETTKTDYHQNGYYQKTIDETDYMVLISYNAKYKSFYLGLSSTLPENYEDTWSVKADLELMIESDSQVYLETQITKILEEKPNIQNIGLDLTFNTGGNVGALYRIVGLMTSEPFAVSRMSTDTGSYSTTYITTTTEAYDQFNWFFLSSRATFSAANELVTIVRQNNLGLIIGQVSGGGAASITPILLPDGTFFTMSSTNLNALRTNDGEYLENETGIAPDVELDIDELLISENLKSILDEHFAE